MIYNPEGFFGTQGGGDRGEGLTTSWTALGLGLGIESGLATKYLLDPVEKQTISRINSISQKKYSGELRRLQNLKNRAVNRAIDHLATGHRAVTGGTSPVRSALRRESKAIPNILSQYSTRRSEIYSKIDDVKSRMLQRRGTGLASIASTRKLFRAVGLTTIAAFGFDIFKSMTTPGLSVLAKKKEEQLYTNPYVDSAEAFTMRQRALQAIMDSQSSLQQVIGNEASYFNR